MGSLFERIFLVELAGIQATQFFRTINFQISMIHVFTKNFVVII